MFRPGRGKNPTEIWGPEEVCEKFGLQKTEQVIDYLGLMGDASDNIPGVPGVGAKTASKLLTEYGSIEGLYQNIDKLKGKLKEKVEASYDKAILSKQLATIVVDIDTEAAFDNMILEAPNPEKLQDIFKELEFRTLLRRLLPDASPSQESAQAKSSNKMEEHTVAIQSPNAGAQQLDMFAITEQVEKEMAEVDAREPLGEYSIVESADARAKLIKLMKSAQRFGLHAITSGFNPMEDELLGFSVCLERGKAFYVPLSDGVLKEFKEVLEDSSKTIVAVNYKFIIKSFAMNSVNLSRRVFDCMVAHYLLDPDSTHRLEQMVITYLGLKPHSIEKLLGKGKSITSFKDLRPEVVMDYASESADMVMQLSMILNKHIKDRNMVELLEEVEFPLICILADIELTGVNLDTQMLNEYCLKLDSNLNSTRYHS